MKMRKSRKKWKKKEDSRTRSEKRKWEMESNKSKKK